MPTDDRLIYLVFTAQQKLKTYLNNTLSSEGVTVTPAQAAILFMLREKDGQSMSELSQVLSMDNSTVTGLVDRLQRSGLVTRRANPDDRRISLIRITPQGVEEIKKAKPVITRVNERIKSGLSEQEIHTFKCILNSFFEKFHNG
jgi:DNA-binding MarR family transcriptional regulator